MSKPRPCQEKFWRAASDTEVGQCGDRRYEDKPILLPARTPVVPRKRSVIGQQGGATEKQTRTVTILHAEDNRFVADTVRETLEQEGWKVTTCSDGATALRRIKSDTPPALLLEAAFI